MSQRATYQHRLLLFLILISPDSVILEEDVLVGAKREPRRLFLFSDLLIVTRTVGRVERLGDPVSLLVVLMCLQ
jgi:hypothetical protein